MGDAILAFFGAPYAHEDDPQRAVLAGLEILEGIRPFHERIEREYNLDFNVRVGISTGPVVVGDIGSNVAAEYTAMGDEVNLAARMEQTAQPGTLQISSNTHKLVAPLFEFDSLGAIEVKGKSEPVPAYRVLGRKAEPGRLRGIEGLNAPLIGRAGEFDTLRQVIEEVRQGRGRIVCLIGEAGLGKSRLIEELRAEWEKEADSESSWLESRGISYDATRPYSLFQQRVRQIFGVEDVDPSEVIREKIARGLQHLEPDQLALCTAAAENLLAARVESDEPQLPAEAPKRELFEALLNAWREMASHTPIVMVFDDLHWADPASLELLLHLFQLTEEVPILLLCAFRPYRQSSGWQAKQTAETDYPHRYTEITLSPLSNEDSDTLIASLLTIADLPSQLRQMILQKTEGNPFFVEEVVRTLIDSGAVVRDESGMHWRATAKVGDIAIPDNLQALLTSRIDRLEVETRRTLQLAAVIGRTFYHHVLKTVSDTAIALDRQLNTLQRVDLIREAARVPDLEYMFRHELTRDAAYNTILRRSRREFHRRVSEAIETMFSDRLEEEAHRLAYHFHEARDDIRALKYSTMAGDAAARLYANIEAITHFTLALELAKRSEISNEQLINLYTSLGQTMELCGQYDDALANYQELETLGRERGDRALELAALISLATVNSTYTAKFDPAQGRTSSERALVLARELSDRRAEAKVLWNLMLLEIFSTQDPQRAVVYGEQSLAIARQHDLREELAYVLNDIAHAYAAVGRREHAGAALEESRGLWRELGNLPMLADNLFSEAAALHEVGKLDEAETLANEALRVSQSISNLWGQAGSLFVIGLIYLERGEFDKGIKVIEDSLPLAEQGNFVVAPLLMCPVLAWVYGSLGDIERGFELAHIALTKPHQVDEYQPLARAALAYLHLISGNTAEADAAFKEAYGEPATEESELAPRHMGLFLISQTIIGGEVALANREYDRVLRLTERSITSMRTNGMRIFLPDILRLKGQALASLGRTSEAREVLGEARTEGEALGSRRSLLSILIALHHLEIQEGNSTEAATLRLQAREIVEFIADHAGTPELRASFLNTPLIRGIMGAA